MVKGISKRVVVVKPADSEVFEEAIFIVREDYINAGGVTSSDIIRQAQKIAGQYTGAEPGYGRRILAKLPAPVFAAAGAAATGLAWIAMRLAGV